jgi:hypothetical protein
MTQLGTLREVTGRERHRLFAMPGMRTPPGKWKTSGVLVFSIASVLAWNGYLRAA